MQKHPELPKAFHDLGVEIRFLKAVHKMGFTEPSEIQRHLIPVALEGRDVMGQARTGTGKTAAFGLPVLQRIDPALGLQAICLAPTRELAVQVTAELKMLTAFADLRVVAIYGGQRMSAQLHQLGRKPHMVVGTPGRIMDFMRRGALNISGCKFVVLDEVDRMLDIGFREDIRTILSKVTAERQTIFVSATFTDEIKRLAARYMRDPVEVNVSQDHMTVEEVDQSYISVERHDKFRVLTMVLKQEDPPVTIVFTNTKAAARKLAKKLFDRGINAHEIHGDLMQRKRDRVMDQFRKNKIQVLVATDLASRGIDVSHITHIVNYDIPPDPDVYVHRIGRTARMGARGTAITFVTAEEGKELTNVEKLINREVPERKVDGFTSQPIEPIPSEAPAAPTRQSRFTAPVHANAETQTTTATPAKTLGGRFRTRRRRKL